MIRIRLNNDVTEKQLIDDFGFTNCGSYLSKTIGQYEIQAKLSKPSNLRIQNWPDNRSPWILFKFLLALEAQQDVLGKIKFDDSGYPRLLRVQDTLDLIEDLNNYTDISRRLNFWYKEFKKGNLVL